MVKEIKWASPSTYSQGNAIAGTTLNGLANDARAIGSAINNDSDKDIYADFELEVEFASSPSAGGYVSLYLVPALDGTNYADGDASVVPADSYLVGSFPVLADANNQRIALLRRILPPLKFKCVVWNKAGQAFEADDNNFLSYRSYNEEVQ